jgi:hypothetical protein
MKKNDRECREPALRLKHVKYFYATILNQFFCHNKILILKMFVDFWNTCAGKLEIFI